jgi:hypothetical protein
MADTASSTTPKSTTDELLSLLDYVHGRILGRLEGITEDEYLWEPVSGCWSVRPGEDGTHRADGTYPDPQPAPFTTIAWRLWHIGADCLGGYCDRFWEGRDGGGREWPGERAGALAEFDRQWLRFRAHVAALDDEGLARPLGPAGGPYAKDSYHALVLHALDEVVHHTAEIGVIRDLYRASGAGRDWRAPRTG